MKNLKKKNNKGFSLVELIVAVAIMAVLMGVLIPTLIRYVEKSKKQKDESAVEEMRYQMELVMAGNADWSAFEGTLVFKGKKVDFAAPDSTSTLSSSDSEFKKYLNEVSINLGEPESSTSASYDFTYSSKHGGTGTVTTFTFKDGKVTATIKSDNTKYGTIILDGEGARESSAAN